MVRFAVDQNISLALQQNPSRLQTIHRSETMLNLKKVRSANDQILNQIANVQAGLTKANNKLETLREEYSTEMRDLNTLVSCIRRPWDNSVPSFEFWDKCSSLNTDDEHKFLYKFMTTVHVIFVKGSQSVLQFLESL